MRVFKSSQKPIHQWKSLGSTDMNLLMQRECVYKQNMKHIQVYTHTHIMWSLAYPEWRLCGPARCQRTWGHPLKLLQKMLSGPAGKTHSTSSHCKKTNTEVMIRYEKDIHLLHWHSTCLGSWQHKVDRVCLSAYDASLYSTSASSVNIFIVPTGSQVGPPSPLFVSFVRTPEMLLDKHFPLSTDHG